MLELEEAAAAHCLVDRLHDARLIVGVDVLAQPAAVAGLRVGDEAAPVKRQQLGPVRVHAVDRVRGGADERAQARFAGAQRIELRPPLILPLTRTQRASRGARQRRDPHGPLEQRDIAQRRHGARGFRRIRPGAGENQDRKIGPRRLSEQEGFEARFVAQQRFLGGNDARRAELELLEQRREVAARHAGHGVAREQLSHHLRITSERREDQQPPLGILPAGCAHGRDISCGTPVSTP